MADFSTWDRATLEQFAQWAMDKMVAQIQRVKELEARLEVDPGHGWDGIACRDETIKGLEQQLAGLRKAHGEPVAWIEKHTHDVDGIWEDELSLNFNGNGTPLYTSAPPTYDSFTAHDIPIEAIGDLLAQAMDQAVANGANSVSMPDEYVEIAAWLAAATKQKETE